MARTTSTSAGRLLWHKSLQFVGSPIGKIIAMKTQAHDFKNSRKIDQAIGGFRSFVGSSCTRFVTHHQINKLSQWASCTVNNFHF